MMESGNGSGFLYRVEAKTVLDDPQAFGSQVFHSKWKRVEFAQGPVGVSAYPYQEHLYPGAAACGLMSYEQARALLFWFINEIAHGGEHGLGLGIEARLVKVKLTWKIDTEEIGVSDSFCTLSRREMEFSPRDAPKAEPTKGRTIAADELQKICVEKMIEVTKDEG